MATREEQERLGREVANQFTQNPKLEFIGFAGLGRHGGALILNHKGDEKMPAGKMVIKYSLGGLSTDDQSDSDQHMRNEYRFLKMLRGAEHIVRLIDFPDCTLNLPGISNGEATLQRSIRAMSGMRAKEEVPPAETAPAGGGLDVRKCPTFALEYLPNGTLNRFHTRVRHGGEWIPNRLLWRIWLCCKFVHPLTFNNCKAMIRYGV